MNIFLIIIAYYLLINIYAFVLMFFDKKQSAKKSASKIRIKEKNLLLIAIFGGFIGSLSSMYLLRHKTKHINFILIFWFSALIHIILFAYILNFKH